MYNRLGNVKNRFQGKSKKVLCVCSAGILRSPTAAVILSQEPFGFNTRAVGVSQEYALVPIDEVLLAWADEIVAMDTAHVAVIDAMIKEHFANDKGEIENAPPVHCLDIPDVYEYMNPDLVGLIKERYNERVTKHA